LEKIGVGVVGLGAIGPTHARAVTEIEEGGQSSSLYAMSERIGRGRLESNSESIGIRIMRRCWRGTIFRSCVFALPLVCTLIWG
jgi:hypothetical protein